MSRGLATRLDLRVPDDDDSVDPVLVLASLADSPSSSSGGCFCFVRLLVRSCLGSTFGCGGGSSTTVRLGRPRVLAGSGATSATAVAVLLDFDGFGSAAGAEGASSAALRFRDRVVDSLTVTEGA
uniref:(northern house mosquito) hypothetical protein n=1 Tax=Culex pipiens TaxID=7175 RepID=A0A8D7ZUY7_CULPI